MKVEIDTLRFSITCEECQLIEISEIYIVTEYQFVKFGERPRAIVTRMCKLCFDDKYPEYVKPNGNQLDMFK